MKKLLLMIGLFGILVGCQNDEGGNNGLKPRKDINLSVSESRVVEGNTNFAFHLFSEMNKMKPDQENWMISPFSLSMVLGMTSNGASGNTLAEIKKVLGHENVSMEETNAFYNKLIKELGDLDDTSQLNIANSVWAQNGIGLSDSFVEMNQKNYNAQVQNLDFASPNALTTINQWCAEQTNQTIPAIVDEISEDTKLILLNALYFKGVWKNKFEERYTITDDFTNVDGSISKVSMMTQSKDLPYAQNEYFSMGRFDYGNGAFGMTILLPNEGFTLDESLAHLNLTNWDKWNNSWTEARLDVKFPKFEMKAHDELDDVLKAMGIKEAFSSDADFSALSDTPLKVGLFEQASFVKVDENGTVMGTVSKGNGVFLAPEPVSFYMNRPFVFIISEQSTGSILLMGKINAFR